MVGVNRMFAISHGNHRGGAALPEQLAPRLLELLDFGQEVFWGNTKVFRQTGQAEELGDLFPKKFLI